MNENLQSQTLTERSIYLHEGMEVAYWMKELGVSQEQLRSAVQQAGTGVNAVKHHLGIH